MVLICVIASDEILGSRTRNPNQLFYEGSHLKKSRWRHLDRYVVNNLNTGMLLSGGLAGSPTPKALQETSESI